MLRLFETVTIVLVVGVISIVALSVDDHRRTTLTRRSISKQRKGRRYKSYDLGFEQNLLLTGGVRYVIGSDESGTGAIAGPVVAASCCIVCPSLLLEIDSPSPSNFLRIPGVADSKVLSREQRENIFEQFSAQCPDVYVYRVVGRSHEEYDDYGVFGRLPTSSSWCDVQKINTDCLRESIQGLVEEYDFLCREDGNEAECGPLVHGRCYSVVDGRRSPKLDLPYRGSIPCRPYVSADSKIYTVALASIIAGVFRDLYMEEVAHKRYPEYDFKNNHGYPSTRHIEAIHKYGPCPLHHMTSRPLKGR